MIPLSSVAALGFGRISKYLCIDVSAYTNAHTCIYTYRRPQATASSQTGPGDDSSVSVVSLL